MENDPRRIPTVLLIVWLILPFLSCATFAGHQPPVEKTRSPAASSSGDVDIEARIFAEFQRWRGTPHRLGGSTSEGIDCSGLVQSIYRQAFGIVLPRTTRQQIRQGQPANGADLKAGDLVFFQPPEDSLHVGIYLSGNRFVHASKSRGVILSEIGPDYWSRHFRTARRILPD
jgi:cell wall-associated NlpC family hydrolase